MTKNILALTALTAIFLGGCTTGALKQETARQSKTVSNLLADEVLYNISVAKMYSEGRTYNGIPSFVTLVSGVSQIQDTITPQLSIALPTHNGGTGAPTYTPQISGAHQTQDNWSFAPVVDPMVLNRLHWLYLSQFQNIGDQITKAIFPTPSNLDQWGRPNLQYQPIYIGTNVTTIVITNITDQGVTTSTTLQTNYSVKMINNQPQFTANFTPSAPKTFEKIPGAFGPDNIPHNPWFVIEPDKPSRNRPAYEAGTYLGRKIWITDREKFFEFAVLALGGTNGTSTLTPVPILQQFNGGIIQLRTLTQ